VRGPDPHLANSACGLWNFSDDERRVYYQRYIEVTGRSRALMSRLFFAPTLMPGKTVRLAGLAGMLANSPFIVSGCRPNSELSCPRPISSHVRNPGRPTPILKNDRTCFR